jgi:hypothetical protein
MAMNVISAAVAWLATLSFSVAIALAADDHVKIG